MYSLTTTTGQGKGTAVSPGQGTLSLPYADNFDSDTAGQQPPYLSQMQGAFEVEPCAGGRTGQCLQQQAPVQPIEWDSNANPFTIGGDPGWSNYTVSADALMEQAGAVQLIGRAGSQVGYYPPAASGYYLQLANTGAWSIVRSNTSGQLTTLASGTVSAPGTGTWQHLALTFNGASISAAINGITVGTVTDSTYGSGMPGFGTSGYQTDQFDNLSVAPSRRGGAAVRPGRSWLATTALSAWTPTAAVRARHQSADVGLRRQRQLAELDGASNGTLQIDGQCLDITGANTATAPWSRPGPATAAPTSNGRPERGTGQPGLRQMPRRPDSNTANGTQLDIWSCNGGTNQQWRLPD